MKRFLILILTIMLSCNLYAQMQGQQELRFVYIAHDENTAVDKLCERLKMIYTDALELPENFAVIFYMANGSNPMIVRVNLPNDNSSDFPMLIESLQNSRFHNSDPLFDVEKILEIFNDEKTDIVTENGKFRYQFVDWSYYVNKTFWSLGLNEAVIASLYWAFDMEKYLNARYMSVSIWYAQGDNLRYDTKNPFGKKDLCGTMPFRPLQY